MANQIFLRAFCSDTSSQIKEGGQINVMKEKAIQLTKVINNCTSQSNTYF